MSAPARSFAPAFTPPDEQKSGTMVYTVDLGNGHVADIEGPPNATPEQLQAAVAEHTQGGGDAPEGVQGGFADDLPTQARTQMSAEDEARYVELAHTADADTLRRFQAERGFESAPGSLEAFVAARDKDKAAGRPVDYTHAYELPKVVDVDPAETVGRGALDSITMGTTAKAGALVAGAESALSGGSFGDAYDRMLDHNNAVVGADNRDHPWLRLTGQLAGGALLPTGLENVAARAEASAIAAGKTVEEAHRIGQIAIRNRLAAVGGGYGIAHGAGSSDTLGDAVSNAAIEGGVGAAGGALFGAAGNALSERAAGRAAAQVAGPATEGRAVAAAAERQGIDVLPADVGGPMTRRLTAAAAQAPLSASPVITASQKMVSQAQGARDRIAADIGQALDPEAAGLAVRNGVQRYIASSGADVRAAYRAAETAAADTRVAPTKAIEALDRNIAELGETPGGAPGLATMQALRDQLAAGDVAPAGLLRMRTVLRDQFMKDGLVGSDTERRIGQVLDAANDDVADGLRNAGKPEAAALYATAAAKYKARITTINQVLKPVIGTREAPRSGEAVAKTLMADLQGNNGRAVRLLRTLPPEEQASTRASIIGSLGNAAPGGQNAEGTAFSLPHFLTGWNKIGETAKRAYFGDEARAALNDLAKVADATKQAQGYANRSNTSGGIWGNLGILASTATVAPVSSAVGGAAQLLGGHLLASPRFARWLARAPRTSLSPTAYAERLTRIARAEPAIANEVLQLQQRLTDAFSAAPTRLAADEGANHGGRTDGNASDQQGQEQEAQP
jgi:hypothetical protein